MGKLEVFDLGEDSLVEIEERLRKLNVDPTFVVEPEHRPTVRPDPNDRSIPVIDLSPFFDLLSTFEGGCNHYHSIGELVSEAVAANNTSLRGLIAEVGKACDQWGFFQVIGHGVPLALLDNLEKITREFFYLPLAEKRKIRRSLDNFLGYFDAELTKNKRDWKEVVDIACGEFIDLPRQVDGEKISDETTRYYNQWPEKPPGFREGCEKWIAAVQSLASNLTGLISMSLGLPFDQFHHSFEDETSFIRLNYYPKCPVPDLALGVSRHKDSGALTVLVQDEVGGLQVRTKNGEWISVQPRRDAFVINLGDIFQVWSNDKYHSIEHRVLVNENKERLSFPLFYNPSHKTNIEPARELLDESNPPKYRAYNFGLFMKTRNNGNYKQLGENIQIHRFAL